MDYRVAPRPRTILIITLNNSFVGSSFNTVDIIPKMSSDDPTRIKSLNNPLPTPIELRIPSNRINRRTFTTSVNKTPIDLLSPKLIDNR